MAAKWRREDIPYDAMGDYSSFKFEEEEEAACEDPDREEDSVQEQR